MFSMQVGMPEGRSPFSASMAQLMVPACFWKPASHMKVHSG